MVLLSAALVAASAGCAGTAYTRPLSPPASLEGQAHVTVRFEAGSVWVSPRPWTEPTRAWRMPAQGPVDQVTLRALPDRGFEVVFRQGGTAWRGELDADRTARSPLAARASASR